MRSICKLPTRVYFFPSKFHLYPVLAQSFFSLLTDPGLNA